MLPPWLAHVNERTGTPVNATIVMLVARAVIGFFTSLGILSNLLSISTLFIFMLVAVALLVRVHHELLQFFQSCVPTSEQALADRVAVLLLKRDEPSWRWSQTMKSRLTYHKKTVGICGFHFWRDGAVWFCLGVEGEERRQAWDYK
jgi:hypothetical protein